ncbi:ABC transporter permease [Methylopila jiangsuensis]|uniref:ABC transporter permease n=1 Tax=Methylopila jiangsuensis TaxID=586230 RepID=A0A9W6JIJ1_9HYPH|nr:putative ABC transport system permease protein [Methylopila jiangsuensis]GLK77692.1 ABC transporter permease [Methylopila jiangsuensis]
MSEIAAESAGPRPRAGGFNGGVILKLAARELRGGVQGFMVFLLCLALGVAAIAGVGSLARGLSDGLQREGRAILGGDAAFSLMHREATPTERAVLEAKGRVSTVGSLRAMARTSAGDATLVELKAVDDAWPLVGAARFAPDRPLAELLGREDGVPGVAVDPALLARLNLKVGDRIELGTASFAIRATVEREPDQLSGGVGFGPRALISTEALRASGLLQPGSLVRWSYRVALDGDGGDAEVGRLITDVEHEAKDAGFEARSRLNAAPQLERNVNRFTQFLTIVGLAALVVGGVGVANAVNAFVDRKRETIAVLKSLGASGRTVFLIHLAQVAALGALGVALGLMAGAALPFAAARALESVTPLPLAMSVYPRELALAATYGALTALAFAVWPLGRAHDVPVAALFRDQVAPESRRPRAIYIAATALAALALCGLAVYAAYDRRIALTFVGASVAAFLALRLVAGGVMALAARLPRPKRLELRLALANIHRPGALTPSVVMSLGLGLALLVALTQIDASIRGQLSSELPQKAPAFFFLDIPSSEKDAFAALAKDKAPGAELNSVPMLRGSITALNGVAAEEAEVDPESRWALRGDRGVTFAEDPPEGSTVTEGAWWPRDYSGEPLISFDQRLANGLGLKVGDRVSVNVLGRTVTAKIANLRRIHWETMGINFFMVFSPNAFAGAPYMNLATVVFPDGSDDATELGLLRDLTRAFPSVTAIRVKDALTTVNEVVGNLALAVRAASGVTLVASVLVLAGALAAGRRRRTYEAVVLKTLGAARARLIGAMAAEYALLGLVTAAFGLVVGSLAAWGVTANIMRIGFAFDPLGAGGAALAALVVTVALGLIGTWRVLGEAPARHLRSL